MAFGNQVAEFKAKTTSRTVTETGGAVLRATINNEGTVSGKLAGMIMYTVHVEQFADGTGKAEAKVAIMGPEGEMASGSGSAVGFMTGPGKFSVRGLMAMHSDHPKWNWLNNTPLAMESVVDMAASEEIGRMFEWK